MFKQYHQTVLFLVLSCSSFLTLADISLKFGLYGSDKASVMVRKFRPILNSLEKDLTKKMGETVKIKIKVAHSYEKAIDNLVTGQVDFARFGPASYILAKQKNPKISILAVEKNEKEISGVLAVKADSDIKSIVDLKGKSFAFGDKNSTTGRFFPQYHLGINGVKEDDLSAYAFLGRHDRVASAILRGKYDAGSFKVSTYKKLLKQGKKFSVLLSYPIVYKPWLARENLSESAFNAIQSALLSFSDQDINHEGFSHAKEADFDLVKKAMDANAIFFSKER